MLVTDLDCVSEHFGDVSEYVEAAVFHCSPGDRDFFDFETQVFCNEKNFCVESEALDALPWKDFSRSFFCEKFEAALRVLDVFDD